MINKAVRLITCLLKFLFARSQKKTTPAAPNAGCFVATAAANNAAPPTIQRFHLISRRYPLIIAVNAAVIKTPS
jgi:hypothetical protein